MIHVTRFPFAAGAYRVAETMRTQLGMAAMDHRFDDDPRGLDRMLFDASIGVVRPRLAGSIGSAWAVAGALLALALLVGAIAYPIATEMSTIRVGGAVAEGVKTEMTQEARSP